MEVLTVSKVSLDQDETESLYRLVESLEIKILGRDRQLGFWDLSRFLGFSSWHDETSIK